MVLMPHLKSPQTSQRKSAGTLELPRIQKVRPDLDKCPSGLSMVMNKRSPGEQPWVSPTPRVRARGSLPASFSSRRVITQRSPSGTLPRCADQRWTGRSVPRSTTGRGRTCQQSTVRTCPGPFCEIEALHGSTTERKPLSFAVVLRSGHVEAQGRRGQGVL